MQLGWSQERLGKEIHSDPATISRWLNGKVRPSKTTLGRIAHATQIDFEWLLTGEGQMRPNDETELSGCNHRELLEMVSKVLSSGGEHAHALAENIRMHYRAVSVEEELRGLEQEVVSMRAEQLKLKGVIRAMEKQFSSLRSDYLPKPKHH